MKFLKFVYTSDYYNASSLFEKYTCERDASMLEEVVSPNKKNQK